MKNIILNIKLSFLFFCLPLVTKVSGQQIANSSHISETRAIWNPAFTATGSDMIFDGFFRMQWLGFAGAPVSGYASLQYPLLDYNMSGGLLLSFDKTGPVSKLGAQLNYAYHLKGVLAKHGQLSLGASANFQQYSFDGSREIFNEEGDMLLLGDRNTTTFPSFGGGFYYVSSTRAYKDNTFFIGVAMSQIYSSKVLINGFDQIRQNHMHLNIGGRFYNYDTYIEPMITANIVNPAIVDVLYGLKYEKEDAFWAGIGFSSASIVAFQGGVIMDEFGSRDAKLKLGVLGTYGVGGAVAQAGPGFEFYIAYLFDKD